MRETRSSGSVRGVRSDPYPYRDSVTPMPEAAPLFGRGSRFSPRKRLARSRSSANYHKIVFRLWFRDGH